MILSTWYPSSPGSPRSPRSPGGPCVDKCTRINTHAIHACLHFYPQTLSWAGQLLKYRFTSQAQTHVKHIVLFRFDLWVWVFPGVKWKSGISPWTLLSANLGRRWNKTEAAIVLFMLQYVVQYCANLIIQCYSYGRLLSIPVWTSSNPDCSCYLCRSHPVLGNCLNCMMVMYNCDLYKAAKTLWYVLILLYKTLILGWIMTLTGTLDLVKDRNVLYKCTTMKHV